MKKHLVKQNKWTPVENFSVSHCEVLQQGTDKNDPHKALCDGLLGLKVQQTIVEGRPFLVRRV